jgi:hypothetical protein
VLKLKGAIYSNTQNSQNLGKAKVPVAESLIIPWLKLKGSYYSKIIKNLGRKSVEKFEYPIHTLSILINKKLSVVLPTYSIAQRESSWC